MKNKTTETIETYNNIVNEYSDFFKTKFPDGSVQFQKEMDILIDILDSDSKILDVGTSIGLYPKYILENSNKKFNIVGIDAAENMIKAAIKNVPAAQFKVMDMRNMNFAPDSFNAIICLATLIHVDDTEAYKILEKLDIILKKRGIIIINVQEYINGEKELYVKEPFNPRFNTYFNRYKKDFFIKWFNSKQYKILGIIDNPVTNGDNIKAPITTTNRFSIIVKKND